MDPTKAPGKIITFYSYKGGTGRSMALANVAWILASSGKRVLVLDWDLEAPGLHRYFRPFLLDKEITSSKGVIDYVTDFAAVAITPLQAGEKVADDWYVKQARLVQYVISLKWKFPASGSIDFIPAGQQGPTYTSRFTAFNWQNFYDRLGGGEFLEAAKNEMRAEYDYILIDSRTGVSDTAGICTVQMPDVLVVCFTYNNQSIEGAAGITQSVYEQRLRLTTADEYKFQVFPIPMRADPFERDKLERRKRFARFKFDPFIDAPVGSSKLYWGEVEVPYMPFYAYEEILAAFKDDPTDLSSILAAMVRITRHVTDSDVTEFSQAIDPAERERVLLEFAETPEPLPEKKAPAGGPTADLESPIEKQIRLAETVYADLTDEEKIAARQLWTRLVRVPKLREADGGARLRVEQDDIPLSAQVLIPKFAQQQVLTLDRDSQTKTRTVEVANEDLLRSWTRLQGWIKDDREFLLWRQGLQEDLTLWEITESNSELLHGKSLTEARERERTRRADLNQRELHFISASRDWTRRRFRYFAYATVLAVLLIPAIFSILQYRQRRETAKKILEQATTIPDDQPEARQLRILLALESKQVVPSDGAEKVLLDNLPLLPRHLPQMKYDNNVVKLALSANGSQVTTVSGNPLSIGTSTGPREDRTVQTRETRTGKAITSFPMVDVSAVSINSDGKYVAVSALERGDLTDPRPSPARQTTPSAFVLRILEATKFSQPIVQTNSKWQFFNLRFSPDSKFFAAVSGDGSVQLVGLPSRAVVTLRSSGVFSLLFGQQSQSLVTLHDDLHVRLWDLPKMDLDNNNLANIRARETRLANFGVLADLSLDGKYIAIIERRNTVNVLLEGSGASASPRPLTHDDAITAAKFTRDGNRLVTASEDGTLRVWDFRTGEEKQPRIYLDGKVLAIVFSPDGNYMVTITSTNVARLWSVKDTIVEVARMNHAAQVEDAAFSLDGNYVATASLDKAVQVWEVNTSLKSDSSSEACARLTRNLTIQEYQKYIPSEPYHATCSNLP